ncbi:MAG: N-6 DNA methylase [Flavobacterium sp.]|nr:N-6 DNA methylase [Flavobacterium sp.]
MFLDKEADSEHIVLLDASKLGNTVKEGKNQRTVLTLTEEQLIIDTFNNKQPTEDLSVVVTKKDIEAKNYSFSAGQYFEVKIEHVDITAEEFAAKMKTFESNLADLFAESKTLEIEIQNNLERVEICKN